MLPVDSPGPSPAAEPLLQAANRQLYALRATVQAQRLPAANPPWFDRETSTPSPGLYSGQGTSLAEAVVALPPHLGWGSDVLTRALRRSQKAAEPVTGGQANPPQAEKPATASKKPGERREQWVKLYPDIGLGMLRQEQTAPGRLWLLLRYLDTEGRGVLRIDIIKQHLCQKSSKLRLCGRRQLRNLLRDGNGLFWRRDKSHVWLRSAGKVAYALGVERLSGRPVALPLNALLSGIGTFRAHLYAAFYSGRRKETQDGSQAMPIARATLADLSGVGESSQRAYEAQVAIDIQANFAVGDARTEEGQEDHAWRQGQALFELKDYRGYQGGKGETYLAWQLPNSYIGGHAHRPKGRQKRINRRLKALVTQGKPGNVEEKSETQTPQKTYFPAAQAAQRAQKRHPERALYWKRQPTRSGRFELWQQIGGKA